MKKSTRKVLIALSSVLVTMLLLPLLAIHLAPADAGMAICFLLFFAVDPLTVIALGIMAGTEWRLLWWIPILCAVAFPLLFSVAVGEIVFDLFIYSAVYLGAGAISMLGTHLGLRFAKKTKSEKIPEKESL